MLAYHVVSCSRRQKGCKFKLPHINSGSEAHPFPQAPAPSTSYVQAQSFQPAPVYLFPFPQAPAPSTSHYQFTPTPLLPQTPAQTLYYFPNQAQTRQQVVPTQNFPNNTFQAQQFTQLQVPQLPIPQYFPTQASSQNYLANQFRAPSHVYN